MKLNKDSIDFFTKAKIKYLKNHYPVDMDLLVQDRIDSLKRRKLTNRQKEFYYTIKGCGDYGCPMRLLPTNSHSDLVIVALLILRGRVLRKRYMGKVGLMNYYFCRDDFPWKDEINIDLKTGLVFNLMGSDE